MVVFGRAVLSDGFDMLKVPSRCSRRLLLQNRLSNNVGGVKHFRAHYSMHSEKSAISLSLKRCRSNQGSLAIKFQVRNSVRPMHLFGPQLDHDYYFELLVY